jgi:hypothetical protein
MFIQQLYSIAVRLLHPLALSYFVRLSVQFLLLLLFLTIQTIPGNSMESKVDMPIFHMESSGIHMEWCWNPYGINHSMTIPSSFHMESMM